MAGRDRLALAFDDERAVANAGLVLVSTLAERLGIEQVVDETLELGERPGAARPGRKLLTLVMSALVGGDSIEAADVLRCGETQRVLGHRVMAPSTLGTFLRSFTFGHVRQLDRAFETIVGRAWAAGAGPGAAPLTSDLDSTIVEVAGHAKQGAGFGYTKRRGYHPILATRSDSGEVLHARMRTGSAQSQRGAERFVRELVQRLRRLGARGPLLVRADSGFWSNKTIAALEQHDVRYSIGVTQHQSVRRAIERIPEQRWQALDDYPPEGSPRSPRAHSADADWSSAAHGWSAPRQSCFPTGATTPSSPTGPSRSPRSRPSIAATRRSSSRSATSRKAPDSTTRPPAASSPTPPGCSSAASRTTSPAGSQAWACRRMARSSCRRSAAAT